MRQFRRFAFTPFYFHFTFTFMHNREIRISGNREIVKSTKQNGDTDKKRTRVICFCFFDFLISRFLNFSIFFSPSHSLDFAFALEKVKRLHKATIVCWFWKGSWFLTIVVFFCNLNIIYRNTEIKFCYNFWTLVLILKLRKRLKTVRHIYFLFILIGVELLNLLGFIMLSYNCWWLF